MSCVEKKISTVKKPDLHYDAVIVGLGKTGLSCFRYLFNQGLNIAITDSRLEPPELSKLKKEFKTASIYLGEISEKVLLASDQIILSPGVSLNNKSIRLPIKKSIPVIGDIELFCQKAQAPIIAVSGSNGKSTVTTIVAEMTRLAGLKTLIGGNIGVPALDLLSNNIPDLYVLELSSFQLETTFSLDAHASVLLNISPDHMDRYSSLKEYVNIKKRIYSGQGLMILNKDDEYINSMIDKKRKNIFFTLGSPDGDNFGLVNYKNEIWLSRGSEKIIERNELGIKGEHNISNALAAMALAHTVNVPINIMADVLKNFTGLKHRCQLVRITNNISWYNDSKATNVGACLASIKGLCMFGDIILIAGGDSKGADLSELSSVVKKYVKKVFLLGVDAKKLAHAIGTEVDKEFANDMHEAVLGANKIANSGDLVLLAPACSSLDKYKNYEERGDAFVSAIDALSNNDA